MIEYWSPENHKTFSSDGHVIDGKYKPKKSVDILKEPSNYLLLQRRLAAPENLPPLENQTFCNVEVGYLSQNLLDIQIKFIRSEAELHRVKTKSNKLDMLDNLLDHYENLHGWKKVFYHPFVYT